jgi:hypothetical protein
VTPLVNGLTTNARMGANSSTLVIQNGPGVRPSSSPSVRVRSSPAHIAHVACAAIELHNAEHPGVLGRACTGEW